MEIVMKKLVEILPSLWLLYEKGYKKMWNIDNFLGLQTERRPSLHRSSCWKLSSCPSNTDFPSELGFRNYTSRKTAEGMPQPSDSFCTYLILNSLRWFVFQIREMANNFVFISFYVSRFRGDLLKVYIYTCTKEQRCGMKLSFLRPWNKTFLPPWSCIQRTEQEEALNSNLLTGRINFMSSFIECRALSAGVNAFELLRTPKSEGAFVASTVVLLLC
jgi:hypothetical protein